MYRDGIALAIYSDSWATMGTAFGPGVRGTSFRAILQSIKENKKLYLWETTRQHVAYYIYERKLVIS